MATNTEGLTEVAKALRATGEEVANLETPLDAIAVQGAELAASYAPKRTLRLSRGFRPVRSGSVASVANDVPYLPPVNAGSAKRGIRPSLFIQRTESALVTYALQQLDTHASETIRRKF